MYCIYFATFGHHPPGRFCKTSPWVVGQAEFLRLALLLVVLFPLSEHWSEDRDSREVRGWVGSSSHPAAPADLLGPHTGLKQGPQKASIF